MTYRPHNWLKVVGDERVRYAVTLIDKSTGKKQVVVVQFNPLEISTCRRGPGGLDGPVARAFAYRLARINMPEWFEPEEDQPLFRLKEDDPPEYDYEEDGE